MFRKLFYHLDWNNNYIDMIQPAIEIVYFYFFPCNLRFLAVKNDNDAHSVKSMKS